jgi:peptidoglycan/xylan/chitin deacetylase (PgdA/CDA1 family)
LKHVTRIYSTISMMAFPVWIAVRLTSANPIDVVPWNGHPGAVSFTFDDGLGSQITNVVPALKQRSIHATFFIPGFGTSSSWVQVAKDGNEIANHTADHVDLTKLETDSVASEITRQADVLHNLDTGITTLTLAYPYCATNDAVDVEIVDPRGRSRIVRAVGGRAETGPLPSGIHRTRIHDGIDRAAQNVMVLQ